MNHPTSSYLRKAALLSCCLWTGLAVNAYAENCQIQLSETTVDYGNLTRAAIVDKQTGASSLSLGDRQMTLNIVCQQAARIGLMVGGAAGQEQFRFGDGGQLTMMLSDALLDGNPVALGSLHNKQVAEPGATLTVSPGAKVIPLLAGHGAKGKSFSVQVHVDAQVTDAATRVRGQTTWQGNTSFSVVEH